MILSSFDIFDTTLIRKCGSPENVFVLLSKALYPQNYQKQEEFVLWRMRVQHTLKGEYNIDDIYESIEKETFRGYSGIELKNAELDMESKLLVANPEVLKIIDKCRNKGHLIAFISDMYLPSLFLRDILKREGAYKDGDGIYVSNEANKRKQTGGLYDIVNATYHPQKWFHYGDNPISDYEIPKKKGIKSSLVNFPYNKIEKDLIFSSDLLPRPYEMAILAGISRAARCVFGKSSEVMLAADYIAAAYIPYMHYVVDDAIKKGITTLFFLLRDGYVLHKISESIAPEHLELRCLFVSRKALRNPFFYIASEKELSDLGLKREKDFKDYLEDYKNCCGYFKKEGLFSDNIGIVDLGWFGSSRAIINLIRKSEGLAPIMTYYFGQNSKMLSSEYGPYNVFCPLPNDNDWKTFVLEEYYSACPWSTTVGYTGVNNNYMPLLKDNLPYIEDEIVKNNTKVCCWMAQIISDFEILDVTLYMWMSYTLKSLVQGKYYIDWTSLKEKYKENVFCLRDLSVIETIKYIRGRNPSKIINIDVCLDLTWGNKTKQRIKKMRNLYYRMAMLKHNFWRKIDMHN